MKRPPRPTSPAPIEEPADTEAARNTLCRHCGRAKRHHGQMLGNCMGRCVVLRTRFAPVERTTKTALAGRLR